MARILEADGKNRASPEEAASFVQAYLDVEEEVDAEKSAFMLRCKKLREKQKDICEDAKSQGVEKKKIKAAAKIKRKLDEIEDIEAEIEEDQDYFVDIRVALGAYANTPLGSAAVAAEKMAGGVDPVAAAAAAEWDKAAPEKAKGKAKPATH